MDETTRDRPIRGLKTREAATDAPASYIDKMALEGVAIKCISRDGAGELGRSVKFQRMLTDRVIREMTRLDISGSVRELSRRVTSPCMRWRGLQHVLHNLAGTLDVGITYKKSTDDDINTMGRIHGF